MEFLTLEASDYESALKQARTQYGNAVRIHTRKDISKGSLLTAKKRCVITYYLVDTKPSEVLVEQKEEYPFDGKAYLARLLADNDIPLSSLETLEKRLFSDSSEVSRSLLETEVRNFLFDGLQFESDLHCRYAIYVGSAGVGKTTTLIKTALHLRARKGKRVALLSFDTRRIGSLEQIRQFASSFSLPLFEAANPEELVLLLPTLEMYDHVLVDTSGRSAKDGELKAFLESMLAILPSDQSSSYLVVSATFKESDLLAQLDLFNRNSLQAIICTKLDETRGIGNLLSFIRASRLALLYLTDGQLIPEDFHQATAENLISRLQGFTITL